jgi:hypothetical protein
MLMTLSLELGLNAAHSFTIDDDNWVQFESDPDDLDGINNSWKKAIDFMIKEKKSGMIYWTGQIGHVTSLFAEPDASGKVMISAFEPEQPQYSSMPMEVRPKPGQTRNDEALAAIYDKSIIRFDATTAPTIVALKRLFFPDATIDTLKARHFTKLVVFEKPLRPQDELPLVVLDKHGYAVPQGERQDEEIARRDKDMVYMQRHNLLALQDMVQNDRRRLARVQELGREKQAWLDKVQESLSPEDVKKHEAIMLNHFKEGNDIIKAADEKRKRYVFEHMRQQMPEQLPAEGTPYEYRGKPFVLADFENFIDLRDDLGRDISVAMMALNSEMEKARDLRRTNAQQALPLQVDLQLELLDQKLVRLIELYKKYDSKLDEYERSIAAIDPSKITVELPYRRSAFIPRKPTIAGTYTELGALYKALQDQEEEARIARVRSEETHKWLSDHATDVTTIDEYPKVRIRYEEQLRALRNADRLLEEFRAVYNIHKINDVQAKRKQEQRAQDDANREKEELVRKQAAPPPPPPPAAAPERAAPEPAPPQLAPAAPDDAAKPPDDEMEGHGKPNNIHESLRKFQIAKRMLYRATHSADSENPRLMASLRAALQKRYQTYVAFKEGMVIEPRTYKPWHRSNAENAAREAAIEASADAPPRRHRKMAPLPPSEELLKMKGGSKSSGFIQRMLAENSRYHYVNPNGKRRRAGHEWPVSKRRSYGWIRGTEAADEDETDPRGQPNYMTMEQILATYPPDSEERGRYLATLVDDTHPEMKEFRQFDPYGQQDWRNEMVERSDWITDKFPQPPSSSEDEGESDSDQEPPPEDDEEDEEEDQYHQGHDPDPEPPAQPARVRRRGISPVERRDLGPVVTGPRRPRRSRRLQGGAGGSPSGSETDSESEGERHARIHEEGRLRGGMLAFKRMQEAKHVAADRSCFNQTAAFHSHYHPEVKNFYYKTYEPSSHNGKFHGIRKEQGIMRFEQALGIKATQYDAIDDKEIPQPGLRAVLFDAQEGHYSGTVHTIGHIYPFTYDPESGTLAFYDPPQERDVRLAKQAGEAIHSGFTHIDARTLPRKYNLHNLAVDTHPNTDEIIFIRSITVYEIPVSTRPGTHRFDPQTKHGFYVRDAKPNPDEDFDDPDFEIFLKERYKEENAEPPHKRAKVGS